MVAGHANTCPCDAWEIRPVCSDLGRL